MYQSFYDDIITVENLFSAWNTFRKGKKKRKDVQLFNRYLEDAIFKLHYALKNQTYVHQPYQAFYVNDPKQRHIHKACVRDRLVHQILYSALYPLYDLTFVFDSYSCRLNKGTHGAVKRLELFLRKVSRNYTRDCFILKCDIKKFFASVDNEILLTILARKVTDEKIIWLIKMILDSFSPGLPLGNLTSQLFTNIYMNELDQYIKHQLKLKYYIRYCDDFVIVDSETRDIEKLVEKITTFLSTNLKLELHPRKISIRKFSWGVDFLGYILLPHYILPRTKTKRRLTEKLREKMAMVQSGKISPESFNQTFQSYLGYLCHARTYKFTQQLKNDLYLHTG